MPGMRGLDLHRHILSPRQEKSDRPHHRQAHRQYTSTCADALSVAGKSDLYPLTCEIEIWLLCCVFHRGARIARARSDELSGRGLLDGVSEPTDASSKGEQRECRIVRKPASLRHREQRKIKIGKLSDLAFDQADHLLKRPRWIKRLEQRRRAWVTLRVERMSEPRDRHARCEMRRDHRTGVRSRDLFHQRANSQRGIAVERPRQRREARQHTGRERRAGRGRDARNSTICSDMGADRGPERRIVQYVRQSVVDLDPDHHRIHHSEHRFLQRSAGVRRRQCRGRCGQLSHHRRRDQADRTPGGELSSPVPKPGLVSAKRNHQS
jgi:hypothetical protein